MLPQVQGSRRSVVENRNLIDDYFNSSSSGVKGKINSPKGSGELNKSKVQDQNIGIQPQVDGTSNQTKSYHSYNSKIISPQQLITQNKIDKKKPSIFVGSTPRQGPFGGKLAQADFVMERGQKSYGPITPKRVGNPSNYLTNLSQIIKNDAKSTSKHMMIGESNKIEKFEPQRLGMAGLNNSPSRMLNLKIKSSKAFENEEQHKLNNIMEEVERIAQFQKKQDLKKQQMEAFLHQNSRNSAPKKALKTVKERSRANSTIDVPADPSTPKEQTNVEKQGAIEKDRLIYQKLGIPFQENQQIMPKVVGGPTFGARSKSMLKPQGPLGAGITPIRYIPGKLTKYERLGLSDPDGSNFVQEKAGEVKHALQSVNSYKYLQNLKRDIRVETEAKREFTREFARAQLHPTLASPSQTIPLLATMGGSLSKATIPITAQENYEQMLLCFQRPGRSKQVTLEDENGDPNVRIQVRKRGSRSQLSQYQQTPDPLAQSQVPTPSSPNPRQSQLSMLPNSQATPMSQLQSAGMPGNTTPTRAPQAQLSNHRLQAIKNILGVYIQDQIDKASSLQPHLNFDRENFSQEAVYQVLSISRNYQQRKEAQIRNRSIGEGLGSKTEEQYIIDSFNQLENMQVAQLSDLLLNDSKIQDGNSVIKKIEREQLQQQLQSARSLATSGSMNQKVATFLQRVGIGAGIEQQMGSGLNLTKMSQDIQHTLQGNSIKNSQSNIYKFKIDAFQDVIQFKKSQIQQNDQKNKEKLAMSGLSGMTQTKDHINFISSSFEPNITSTLKNAQIMGGKNPFNSLSRVNSRLSIQQHLDPEFQIPEESYAADSQYNENPYKVREPEDIHNYNENTGPQATIDSVPFNEELLSPTQNFEQNHHGFSHGFKGTNHTPIVKQLQSREGNLRGLNQKLLNLPQKQHNMTNQPSEEKLSQQSFGPDKSGSVKNQLSDTADNGKEPEYKGPKLYPTILQVDECIEDPQVNLEDDFARLEFESMRSIADCIKNMLNVRRGITPIFSGAIGQQVDTNEETMQRVFGVTQGKIQKHVTFFNNDKVKERVYYKELVQLHMPNRAIHEEIERQIKTNGKCPANILVEVLQMQFKTGLHQMMNVTQKMYQKILNENVGQFRPPLSQQFITQIQKKQHPLVLKSPYVKATDDEKARITSETIVPLLISSNKCTQGNMPSSRLQLACAYASGKFWFFGGNAGTPLCDLKSLHLPSKHWITEQDTKRTPDIPAMFGHSMHSFCDRYLILFGGAGQFFERTKRRETMNDIWILDTQSQYQTPINQTSHRKWIQCRWFNDSKPDPEDDMVRESLVDDAKYEKSGVTQQSHQNIVDFGPPEKRMSHASALFGGCLCIHGGYNGEGDQVLGDFALYDIALKKWVKFKQPKLNRLDAYICNRYQHSMTAVIDSKVPKAARDTRIMWIQDPLFLITNQNSAGGNDISETGSRSNGEAYTGQVAQYEQDAGAIKIGNKGGLYLFGGLNPQKEPLGDFYHIEPGFHRNVKYLTRSVANYKASVAQTGKGHATICCRVTKVEATGGGQSPSARYAHGSAFVSDRYVVIHGGRNDTGFSEIKNIGLNDIHLFDVHTYTWTSVAIYNQVPTSRWAHILCSEGDKPGSLIIFGGVNMASYCDTTLYEVNFDQQDLMQFVERGEQIIHKLKRRQIDLMDPNR